MKPFSTKLIITIALVFTSLISFTQNTKDVDLSIDKIFPAVQGNIPNGDIDDLLYPYYGGYKYVPKHIIQGFNIIGLPVNHPGEDAITFDWQLTLTQDPGGLNSLVFDQTESFTLSTGESDIITFGNPINQNEVGTYRLTATLSSPDDANSANNSVDFDYYISDTEYGYADKNNISSSFTLHDNPLAQNGDGVGIVTYFPEPAGDPYTINSISVYVADDYTGVIDNGNAFFIGLIWPRDELTGEWDFSGGGFQTNPKMLTSDDLNEIITLDLTSPLEITEEKEYLVAMHIVNNNDLTDGGRVSIGADPNRYAANDLTCVQILNGDQVEYADYTPAIWANVAPAANPANDEAEITAYAIAGQVSSSINAGAQTIDVTVPGGTDVSNLTATFALSAGAAAAVGGTPQESGLTANDFSSPVTYTVTAEDGTTTKDWVVTVTEAASSEAEITAYSLPGQTSSNIGAGTQTIDIVMPNGTDVSSLAATFTLSAGANATVGGTPQESGVTTNDFSSPVTYTVTAEDGTTTKDWVVTVTEEASTEAEILAYSINGQTSSNIDAGAQTIDVTVPNGTDLTNLLATFTLSAGANATVGGTPQESGVTANDFSSPVTYIITAEDGTTTKDWVVTVTEGVSTESDITAYSIDGQTSSNINAGAQTIDVIVPNGTDVTNLVAIFTLSNGATVAIGGTPQESGVTVNDFTSPVTYTVTAEDGTTTKNWVVTVTPGLSNQANVLTFNIPGQTSSNINDVDQTVDVVMPIGTDLTALIAEFTLSTGASANIGGTPQESGVTENDFTIPVVYTIVAEDGVTGQDWTVTVTTGGSDEADITAYSIDGQLSSDINAGAQTVNVTMANGTDVTNLVATFSLSNGATAAIGGTPQESGVTANDFTSPVTYTVTAEDGATTKDWTVTVTFDISDQADILTYTLPGQISSSIDAGAQTISVIVPTDTDVTNLIATYTLSTGASAAIGGTPQESGVTANDFTNPVVYTVTAEDGTTTKDWTVTVSEQSAGATDFISYSIDGNVGIIDLNNGYIRVEVPGGTDLTQLTADFEVVAGTIVRIGTTVQESGITVNDFSDIVEYRLIPETGVSKKWYIDVVETSNMNTNADFAYFGFYGQTQPAEIDTQSNFISVNLDPNLDVTQLIPIFYLSDGAIAYIGNSIQWSGENVVDFSSGVSYIVIAEDGVSSELWTVQVTTNQNSAAKILSFTFPAIPGNDQTTTINQGARSINVAVPQGTPRNNLVAQYQLSSGASAEVNGTEQINGVTANNFNTPVIYTITSQNGDVEESWIVSVTYAVGIGENELLSFNMYPNPAKESVTIQLSQLLENTSLKILNMVGKTVHVQELNALNSNIDIASLEKGIYLVVIGNSTDQTIEKLIIR